jgi:hypothetical protein
VSEWLTEPCRCERGKPGEDGVQMSVAHENEEMRACVRVDANEKSTASVAREERKLRKEVRKERRKKKP